MFSNRQLFQRYLAQTSDSPIGLEIEYAEGIYLYSVTGKKYMDLISGISVSNTGHRHPKVLKAIQNQLDKYLHLMVYGEYIQSPQVQLAEKLSKILPSNLSSVYFVNSGSEAVEGALKLAKKHTGRTEIFSYHQAYHGSTHGSLSLMGDDRMKTPFAPLLPEVYQIPFNEERAIVQITEKTACVIIEPIQGEAGIIPASREYMHQLRKRCSETGTLLIFDEIQTGFGRTGRMFALENYGIEPDILVIAKGMGGGLPLGAFISSPEIMSVLSHDPILGHITTFGGNPVCCAASLANIEVIMGEKLAEQVQIKSDLFRKHLGAISVVKDYRSAGLMIAIELDGFNQVKRVIDQCLEHGVIVDWFLFNSSSIRIAPPLTITLEEVEIACKVISQALLSLK